MVQKTSGSEEKRVITIFDAGTKSSKKYDSRYRKRSRAKPKFLLGRFDHEPNIIVNQKIIPKRRVKTYSR